MRNQHIIEVAKNCNSLRFLQFIWEATWEGKDVNSFSRKSLILNSKYLSSMEVIDRKKSSVYYNTRLSGYTPTVFNKGLNIIVLSDIISFFNNRGNTQAIK
jgi:hypothetical protein